MARTAALLQYRTLPILCSGCRQSSEESIIYVAVRQITYQRVHFREQIFGKRCCSGEGIAAHRPGMNRARGWSTSWPVEVVRDLDAEPPEKVARNGHVFHGHLVVGNVELRPAHRELGANGLIKTCAS